MSVDIRMYWTSMPLARGLAKRSASTARGLRCAFIVFLHRTAPPLTELNLEQIVSNRKSQASSREVAMLVKDILASKGTNVVTINPTTGLIEATNLMAERRIGAIVILGADDRIVGILSERDSVRVLAEHGPKVLSEPVSQVMTRDVKTCSEDENIGDLMSRMTGGKFRHLPVVQREKLIGIVSIGDVVKSRVEEINQEAQTLREYIQTA